MVVVRCGRVLLRPLKARLLCTFLYFPRGLFNTYTSLYCSALMFPSTSLLPRAGLLLTVAGVGDVCARVRCASLCSSASFCICMRARKCTGRQIPNLAQCSAFLNIKEHSCTFVYFYVLLCTFINVLKLFKYFTPFLAVPCFPCLGSKTAFRCVSLLTCTSLLTNTLRYH